MQNYNKSLNQNSIDDDLKDYKGLQKIGEGTYGLVFKAKDKKTVLRAGT